MLSNLVSTTYFCQLIETILTCFIFLLAFTAPNLGARYFEQLEIAVARLSRRPWLAVIVIVFGVAVTRLLLLALMPVPAPSVHDEFSYRLASETFAAGRLANPTHAFWQHFESVHILQRPAYMSMYPPGQGLMLAAGRLATGCDWAGVLASAALLCGALIWALRGWFPNSWALAITAIAAVRWLLASYWMNSYWGGALPALGGALIFGSIPRLAKAARVRDAVALGMGVALLANTRPYEGLIVSLTAIVIITFWARRIRGVKFWRSVAILWVLAAILASTAGGMLYYNSRLTKNPLMLPYLADRKQYAIAPLFVWASLRPEPKYASDSLRNVYLAEVDLYRQARSNFGLPEMLRKLKNIWIFYLGPLFSVPLLFFIFGRDTKSDPELHAKKNYIGVLLLTMLAALLQVVWFYPHYAAPAFPAFVAMLLCGLRALRGFTWKQRPVGLFLSRALPAGCLMMAIIPISAHRLGLRLSFWPLSWAFGAAPRVQTPDIQTSVLAEGKKALIFVEYSRNHDPGYEWVYNAADIDRAAVVWARPISPEQDAALVRYFHDRSVWVLNPDAHPLKLEQVNPRVP